MDIKQISYFMAVAQEGSFSRAAEKLEVSQPTLSMAVKKLEEELGAELFYSFNRRQNLTDEGLRLKEGAAKLLEVYQETIENVKLSDYVGSGAVTLGLSPLFGACFFGDLIPSFSAAYPNIKINMLEDGANKIDELVEKGEVDLAVTLNTERTASFASCHFSTQRNVALLHKKHPLANAKSITVADLKEDSFAIFNQDFILNRQIMSACHAAGFRPKIALLSSQWDFMVELVSRNRAVSILPKPVLDKHPDPNVVCVPLMDSMKYWDIVLAWNKQKYMSKSCRLFLDYVKENLPPDDF
ncbi:MAG: hypothetical protein BHV90_17390 [Clostridiales bacterium 42_27]|nr:MAG: hypothetical protein BHV90_17390 [Clostridiales bacterium 42_27]